jgi:hypothetical protein
MSDCQALHCYYKSIVIFVQCSMWRDEKQSQDVISIFIYIRWQQLGIMCTIERERKSIFQGSVRTYTTCSIVLLVMLKHKWKERLLVSNITLKSLFSYACNFRLCSKWPPPFSLNSSNETLLPFECLWYFPVFHRQTSWFHATVLLSAISDGRPSPSVAPTRISQGGLNQATSLPRCVDHNDKSSN